MAETTKSPKIYQLKITLMHVKPPIWRRIQLSGDTNLHQLHDIIQTVMGWEDDHLHMFIAGDSRYSNPRGHVEDAKDEAKVTLSKVAPRTGSKFSYEYDFGDGWVHSILVEKILPKEDCLQYPVCIDGKRVCPPEDCGGPWGYMQLLETLKDPESEDYEDMMDWTGGELDSENFDCARINDILRRPSAI